MAGDPEAGRPEARRSQGRRYALTALVVRADGWENRGLEARAGAVRRGCGLPQADIHCSPAPGRWTLILGGRRGEQLVPPGDRPVELVLPAPLRAGSIDISEIGAEAETWGAMRKLSSKTLTCRNSHGRSIRHKTSAWLPAGCGRRGFCLKAWSRACKRRREANPYAALQVPRSWDRYGWTTAASPSPTRSLIF